MKQIDRRNILLSVLGLIGSTALPPYARGSASKLSLPNHSAAAIHLGQMFLANHPAENTYQKLAEAVGINSTSPYAIASIKVRISNDFERDDVVVLDGWILARTEGRLCALAVLQKDSNHCR